MRTWQNIFQKYPLIILLTGYFVIHLIHLTLLPIFNDEAIYLDWAWSYTHTPNHLYDSLLDAKQPGMIWLFGFFERFFPDPLVAGRFAAVVLGGLSMAGIYVLTRKLFTKNIAVLAAVVFSITPLFVFYNRQALMEAGIMCLGIWSCIAFYSLWQHPTTKNSIILGVIFGIGFFIKSSMLIFILSALLIVLYAIFRKRKTPVKAFCISLAVFIGSDILLFINPLFWQTFGTNSRYTFTPAELFSFPIQTWMTNILGLLQIGWVFMTPLLFISAGMGIYTIYKAKQEKYLLFLSYFSLALLLEIFSVKSQGMRYLVSFMPFLLIPAAYYFSILWSGSGIKKVVVIVAIFIPLVVSYVQISNPAKYIVYSSQLSSYANTEYIRGQTSGYEVAEAVQYIKEHSSETVPSMVLVGFNIGNPESGVDLYTQKERNLFALHTDAKLFEGLDQYQCMTSQYPVFFITRQDQRLGLERFFVLATKFKNPHDDYFVGIYTLPKECKGKTLSLSDLYGPAMTKMNMMKRGEY